MRSTDLVLDNTIGEYRGLYNLVRITALRMRYIKPLVFLLERGLGK